MRIVTKRCLRLAAAVAFVSAFALAFAPGTASAAAGPQRAAWWDMTVAGGAPPPTTVPSPPPTTLPSTTVPETTLPPPPPVPSTTLPATTLPATTVPGTTVPSSTTVPTSSNAATLEVGNDDAQYTEIAAIQYSVPLEQSGLAVDPKSIDALLVLTVVPGASAGTPKLVACPVTSNWSPGADQMAKTAPHYDCKGTHAAKGVYNAFSLTETWNLSWPQERTGHPGVFSVAILPEGAPRKAGVFHVSLKPDASSFQVMSWQPTGGQGAGVPPPPPVAPPPPSGSPPPGLPGSAAPGGSAGGSSVGFTAPSAPAGPSSPSAPAAGSPSAAPSSAGSGTTPVPLGSARPAALRTGLGVARGLAIGLLVVLGLLLSSASGRTTRPARLLVPLPARAGAGGGASGDAPPAG